MKGCLHGFLVVYALWVLGEAYTHVFPCVVVCTDALGVVESPGSLYRVVGSWKKYMNFSGILGISHAFSPIFSSVRGLILASVSPSTLILVVVDCGELVVSGKGGGKAFQGSIPYWRASLPLTALPRCPRLSQAARLSPGSADGSE